MQFWGVEVKSGEPLQVQCGDDFILHLSQATLGEWKKEKGTGPVSLSVKIGGKKLVLGTLYPEKVPQLQFDLVFEREFELSHTGKNGSVYFMGYKVHEAENDDSELEGEGLRAPAVNGAAISLTNENKPAKEEKAKSGPSGTKHVKIVEPKKDDEESDEDSDEDDDYLDSDDESDEDEDAKGKSIKAESESDDDDDDEDDSDDEEETDEEDVTETKDNKTGKKRSALEAKTPAPSKKAKMVTPQKTGGKKPGEHQATPHPAKLAAKTAASNSDNKSHACKSCSRTFGSDTALQSHTKAKHGDGK